MKNASTSASSEPERDDLLPEYRFDYRNAKPNRFEGSKPGQVESRELEAVATVHFSVQSTTGYGDYAEEREALFEELTLDQALAAMRPKAR